MLLELLEQLPRARVLELGTGYGSTPIVLRRSGSSVSLETDRTWFNRLARYADEHHQIVLWSKYSEKEWTCPYLHEEWDIAFVDNSPASTRQSNLSKLAATARFVVCHDTQECFGPSASRYGWDFTGFRHVWTYTRFETYTTVASDFDEIPIDSLPGIPGQPPFAGGRSWSQ